MSLRGMIDRKLVLMVVTPIARAILSLLVGYLTAKGVPAGLVDQLVAAVGVASVVVFNIAWELIDRKRAETKAVSAAVAKAEFRFGLAPISGAWLRDQYEKESG